METSVENYNDEISAYDCNNLSDNFTDDDEADDDEADDDEAECDDTKSDISSASSIKPKLKKVPKPKLQIVTYNSVLQEEVDFAKE